MAESYLSRGVSPTKEDVKEAIKTQNRGLYPGAFCKIVPDIAGDENYCSVIHADGAGTKSILAYLYYKETGDAEIFKGIAQDSLVMNIDDMLCVGAVNNFIVSNTIGRNAHRIDKNILKAVIEGYDEVIQRLKKYNINIYMAGGETADIGDLTPTVIVDSTVFARIERSKVLTCDNIKEDDVIIALGSYGKSVYENSYNSGIGSNGFTLARHVLLSSYYKDNYPETYSTTIDKEKIYSGKYRLTDKISASNQTVGEALLSPTRTYLPVINEILDKKFNEVHAIIHCTGGGIMKSKNFGKGLVYIKDNLFDVPEIFKEIQSAGNIPDKEMFSVFNMGHRMELYCNENNADEIINVIKKYNIDAKVIGKVEKNDNPTQNKVVIKHNGNSYIY
ncbi:MAG: AIR synthase-related protein [Endomicrobia bacterium]|nr:AIR synthase-related protein [Endomicrobiia bacterium]